MKTLSLSRTDYGRSAFLLALVTLLTSSGLSSAATSIWDNGDGTSVLNTANNWNPNGVPDGENGTNIAQWNGSVGGNLNLTFNANFGYASSNNQNSGIKIHLTASQTGSVAINKSGATGNVRINQITLDSSSGAFSVGTSGTTFLWFLGGDSPAPSTTFPAFVNNSGYTATIGDRVTIYSGYSNKTRNVTFGGSGGWDVAGKIGDGTDPTNTITLTKAGGGTTTLSGANGYTGTTTISEGILSASNIVVSGGTSNLGNATSAVVLGAASTKGTLSYTGNSATYTRGFTLGNGGGQLDVTTSGQTLTVGTGAITGTAGLLTIGGAGNTTITSAITTGTGGLTKTGAGTLTLSNSGNTYTGGTTVSEGTLALSGAGRLADTGAVTVSGGTLNLGGISDSVGAVTLNSGTISNGMLTGTSYSATDTGTVSAILAGSGVAFTKTGAGTVTFTAANTYTGNTIVSAGTLLVNGSLSTASAVQVGVSGTLAGSGSVGAISGAGTVAPGNSPGILTALSVDGSTGMDFAFEIMAPTPTYGDAANSFNDVLRLTAGTPFVTALDADNTVTVDFSSLSLAPGQTYTGGFYADAGDFAAAISGANFVFVGADGFTISVSTAQQTANFGSGNVNGWVTQFDVVAIPEPSTALLLTAGLMLVLFRRRRSHLTR